MQFTVGGNYEKRFNNIKKDDIMDIKVKLYHYNESDSGFFKIEPLNNNIAIETNVDGTKTLVEFFKPIFLFKFVGKKEYKQIHDFLEKENSLTAFDDNCNIIDIEKHYYDCNIKENDIIHLLFNTRQHPPEIAQKLIKPIISKSVSNGVFISHGRSNDWREVQEYIEKTLDYKTVELAQQPNLGRTVLQKLTEETDKCHCAVIVMTGDDIANEGEIRARENVIHEIGYFQGKYGLEKVVLLHENGVNIPSNIHGIIYISFPKDTIKVAFGELTRELKIIMK